MFLIAPRSSSGDPAVSQSREKEVMDDAAPAPSPHLQSRMCNQIHSESMLTHTQADRLRAGQHMGHAVPVLPAPLGDECWEHLDHLLCCSIILNLRP